MVISMVITKKNTLMQEYSLNKEQFSDIVQYRKNYENYYGKEVERFGNERLDCCSINKRESK